MLATSAETLVLDFAAIDADALALVGGKAANLGVLTRAGFPVPPGVCVTTEAYRQVAASAELNSVFIALAATSANDTARLSAIAADARAAILAAPVPEPVARAILNSYRTLGKDAPVAVRS